MRTRWLSWVLAVVFAALMGCGSTPPETTDASDAEADTAADSATDVQVDSADDASADVEDAGPVVGDPAQLVFGETVIALTNTRYGSNADGSLRLELYVGGNGECPTMDSPTPDQTIVIGSVPNEAGSHDVSVVLFDFAESVTMEPLLRGDAGSVQLTAATEDNAPLQVSLNASFSAPTGELEGDATITHCSSLDE